MKNKQPNLTGKIRKSLKLKTKLSQRDVVKVKKRRFYRGNVSRRTSGKRYRRRNKESNYRAMKKGVPETQTLCDSMQDFSIRDMERAQVFDYNGCGRLPSEVVEWQKQEEIAYWKSRAISLELENKMLREHLKHVYAQHYETFQANSRPEPNQANIENISSSTNETESSRNEPKTSGWNKEKDEKIVPKEPIAKNRLREMEKIYGDMAPRIMGMETALELNYDRILEEGSRPHWPTIPFKHEKKINSSTE